MPSRPKSSISDKVNTSGEQTNFAMLKFGNRLLQLGQVISVPLQRPSVLSRTIMSTVKPKVYVTRNVPPKGMELLSDCCDVTQWESDEPVPREELLKQVQGVDALFCLLTERIDDELLDAAGKINPYS